MIRTLAPLLFFAFVVLGACQSADSTSSSGLAGKTWVFEKMSNFAGSSSAVFEPEQPNITFEPGRELSGAPRVSGFAGVNRFSGTYTVGADNKLSFSPLASTMMAGDPKAMEFEAKFLRTLMEAKTFEVDGSELIIQTAADRIHFVAQ